MKAPWEIKENKKEQDRGDASVDVLESHQGVEGVDLGGQKVDEGVSGGDKVKTGGSGIATPP